MRHAVRAVLLLALLPPAVAVPSVELRVEAADRPLAPGEELAIHFAWTLTCGDPPPQEFTVELQLPSGNYFNVTAQRTLWRHVAGECLRAGGRLSGDTAGTFRFDPARHHLLTPLQPKSWPVAAWVGLGDEVWAQGQASLRATPDAHLLIGAELQEPTRVERRGGLTAWSQWTVRNHGRGEFVATVRVESAPEWLEVDVPSTVVSGPDSASGSTAAIPMQATMPSTCPAPTAVVTLRLDARSPAPQSRAVSEGVLVQGVVRCPPPGAPASTPSLGAAAALALVAAAAAWARRATEPQHKR